MDEFKAAEDKRRTLQRLHKAVNDSPDGKLRIKVDDTAYAMDDVKDNVINTYRVARKEKLLHVYVLVIDGTDEWICAFNHEADIEQATAFIAQRISKSDNRICRNEIGNRDWHLELRFSGFKEHCRYYLDELRFEGYLKLAYISGKKPLSNWDSRKRSESNRVRWKNVKYIRDYAESIGMDPVVATEIATALGSAFTVRQIKEILLRCKQGLPIE